MITGREIAQSAMAVLKKTQGQAASVICFCGFPASLRSNSLLYNGKEYGNGKAWICNRFPVCRGSVGTHPDGKPLGTIPDPETKKLRIQVHALVDPHWKNRTDGTKQRNRGSVYSWLRRIMDLPGEQVHIGMFSKEQCLQAIEAIKNNPYEERRKDPNAQEEIA